MSLKAPELSLDIINDALEYHSHAIVNGLEDGDADEHWDSLRYFWKISAEQQPHFGRIFHRCRLAELVYYGCHLHPYGGLDEPLRRSTTTMEQQQAMINWTPHEWESLRKKLLRLCHSCKREDAGRIVRNWDEELTQHHLRAQDRDLFGRNIKNLVDHIEINKHLSLLRLEMEQWIVSNSRKQPHIDPKALQDFWNSLVDMQEQDTKKHRFLRQFLTQDSTARKPKLAPMDDLAGVLKVKPCNLEVLQADLLGVALSWNKALFENGEPALSRLGYGNVDSEAEAAMDAVYESEGDEKKEEQYQYDNDHTHRNRKADDQKPAAKTSLEDMRRARASLQESAPDPLPEVYETAGYANVNLQPYQVKMEEDDDGIPIDQDSLSATILQSAESARGKRHDEESQSSHRRRVHKDKSQRKRRSRERIRKRDDESESTEPAPADKRRDHGDAEVPGSSSSPKRRRRSKEKYNKKKSAHRLRFDSDDEDDDVKSVRISELPKFRQPTPPERKKQRSSKGGTGGRRRFFTTEEKDAIRDGVRRFGHGKWRDILDEFPDTLKDRTNVQIKDCFRTMMKNGEV